MSAELLRKAATILRERADDARLAVGDEPWKFDMVGWCDPHGVTYHVDTTTTDPGKSLTVAHAGVEESAVYIAMMNPSVGLALAGWLEQEADDAAEREADGHTLGPRWPGLILARLIVGEQA